VPYLLRPIEPRDHSVISRFYQRRGFRLSDLRPGAVAKARLVKPQIPEAGQHGIPMRDELELLLPL
jgi:hypothetical protein